MFEDALRQAPREELVEHIRLQRELIHRLHRRVLELEDSLERVYRGMRPATQSTGDRSHLTSSPASAVEKGAGLQLEGGTHTPPGTGPFPHVGARLPPTLVPPPPLHRAGAASASPQGGGGLRAPEPRRQAPRPHAEERSPTVRTASLALVPPPASDALEARMRAPAPFALSAATAPADPLSPSSDHPTLLEGIKEINLVLAAHRAGRPALPLPVVEELEEIRTRLLRGFKQAYFMGGDEEATDDASQLPPHIDGARAQDAPPLQPPLRSRLGVAVDADEGGGFHTPLHGRLAQEGDAAGAGRVCPRWVSPESSRVVYGTSPHRRW